MSAVSVSGLRKSYGAHTVLDAVDLDVPEGALTAVLGPSGCGKSTLLRIIAGFVSADAGTVRIGERLVVDGARRSVPARERGVGYVPQEGALFPHLSVAANIAYGLPRRDRRGAAGRERVAELLDLVELPADLARRAPHQLSGGQQQRVALARALAPRPAVVVLDEPFSSLDAALRATAGRAVRRALRQAGATGLLVTHDQGEAMSLADDVAVLRGGHVVQADPPSRLYAAPRDLETARFVGGGTALAGRVDGDPRTAITVLGELRLAGELPPGAATVLVRPEQVEIGDDGHPATVEEVDFFGAHVVVQVRLPDAVVVTARGPAHAPPEPGEQVHVRVTGESVAFPEGPGA